MANHTDAAKNNPRIILRNERGISLLLALFLGITLSSIGYATFHSVIITGRTTGHHTNATQAFWIAEAGLERALHYLRFASPPPGGTAPFTYQNNIAVGNGSYTTTIDPDDANTGTYIKGYSITVSAMVGDISRSVSSHVRTSTFGKYAYLTGSEGGTIWFTSSDLVEGPLHSNDRISITGTPTFMGKVTSSATSFNQGSGYNPDFQAGYQLGVPQVTFPVLQDVIDNYLLENGGSSPALTIDARFTRDSEITFNADGTMTYSVWYYNSWGSKIYIINNQVVDLASISGMINVKGDVRVKGTINGQVTLLASDNIYITDDILYHDSDVNGIPSSSSTDLLGMISVKNVIVADNTANRTDCTINGAILTLGDSFTVENYASGSHRGVLSIYGSLSQKVRGPVGTFGGWYGATGYNKNYHYDQRLNSMVPPYFPTTGQYEVTNWTELSN
ncbi:DUF4900 domain-containing protein [candidate division KSB1 bacterium]|nr:DUF4900 domain-containing protein [candidate division KSB1 bacterium]